MIFEGIRKLVGGAVHAMDNISHNPTAQLAGRKVGHLLSGALDGTVAGLVVGLVVGYFVIKRHEHKNTFADGMLAAVSIVALTTTLGGIAGIGLQLRQ